LGVNFPHDFKALLQKNERNRFADGKCVRRLCGEPRRQSVGVYSYPRDLKLIKQRIEHIRASGAEIVADLAGQGFELPPMAKLVPVALKAQT
jgi:hypothetical protein